VPPDIHYPDVATPVGWPYYRQGLQIRVVPPGRTLDDANTMIVVSPLVPRQDTLPEPDKLVEAAIFTESRQRFEIVTQRGPTAIKAQSGLEGIYYEVLGYVRPRFPREKRIYVMYADPLCYYAVSYLSSETSFETHVETFWKMAKSVRAFRGHKLIPTGPSPLAIIYGD
jgi:hypothetical protein